MLVRVLLLAIAAITAVPCAAQEYPNRTIRIVQSGFALMRGGYRDLLRQSRRNK